jgi:7-cyano-7-deazaguanine synthase
VKSLVLMSGGPDSFVSAAITREHGSASGLFVNVGQAANGPEAMFARRHADFLGLPLRVIDLSSLVEELQSLGSGGTSIFKGAGLPLVGFSGALAISIGFSSAVAVGAQDLVLGLHSDDASHPEYRTHLLHDMARLGSRGHQPIQLVLPLQMMTKRRVFEVGLSMGLPLDESWSCLGPGPDHCLKCLPCRTRLSAFGRGVASVRSRPSQAMA